jgi:Chaperone of endosialidase
LNHVQKSRKWGRSSVGLPGFYYKPLKNKVFVMSIDVPKVEQATSGLDEAKRKTLTRLVTGTAFVAPVVASFAMDGLTISKAVAQANGTGSGLGGIVKSDRRLKSDVSRVGSLSSGLNLYRFRYLGEATDYVGVMAQEVLAVAPEAVTTGADGFLRVDYHALGTRMMTYADWKNSQAA